MTACDAMIMSEFLWKELRNEMTSISTTGCGDCMTNLTLKYCKDYVQKNIFQFHHLLLLFPQTNYAFNLNVLVNKEYYVYSY